MANTTTISNDQWTTTTGSYYSYTPTADGNMPYTVAWDRNIYSNSDTIQWIKIKQDWEIEEQSEQQLFDKEWENLFDI